MPKKPPKTSGRERKPKKPRTPKNRKPTSPERLKAQQKAEKALALRINYHNWDDVARESGYKSRGAAYCAVMKLLDEYPIENVDQYRKQELARLERMLEEVHKERELFIKVLRRQANGDEELFEYNLSRAIAEMKEFRAQMISIGDRIRRILGLNQDKAAVVVEGGDAKLIDRLSKLTDQHAKRLYERTVLDVPDFTVRDADPGHRPSNGDLPSNGSGESVHPE